ncbi:MULTISPECIES: carbohydrate ABC transporter permease [unclassified Arthrobacter]|uniref:carbohydrate ABC transporter permease n=1 Tax=unclassified Arthrobacter TaxID=235627 RepID=UPI001E4B1CCA|nr:MULTISPECIES: carbohydrate ABC transporter permease [unclassified Arthrobacter]MCC9145935.1 carbohydrate ABC transporter permease [Arthrobacter sp. zg-Y919]MDK1277164.1 carbohydrate ABC transporter permease [Arthrobacter sp. zg.Y919]MDM7990696.1 carbohydrate ABC transporter permease [Arthrobacter sp. zg-Y877]WIB03681.1 carbohydrate ABC transporter permease [Arthrobacter sp. zg-Y919]
MRTSRSELILGRLLLAAALILTLLPLISMLSAALQPADRNPTGIVWPTDPQWGNFVTAFEVGNVWRLMTSSAFIVLGVVPASMLIATLAGYALGALAPKGGRAVLIFFVAGLTIPFEALIIPLYYQSQSLGTLNTPWAVIFPLLGLFMPFSVFWMRAHFINVPRELSEAARVDGASVLQEFRQIQLPLALPALSALAILLFLWTWNQFLLPVVLIADPLDRTVAGALTFFQGQYSLSIPLLNAGALLIITPAIVVFLIFQRQFVRALLQGAVKG